MGSIARRLLPVDKVADSEIDRVVDINTKGAMYCIRAALKEMLKNKKGSIVNVSSVAGVNGGGAAYVASKAAPITGRCITLDYGSNL